jgi:hypothetical protein
LKNYQQPRPLSEDQKSQLRSIVEEAENEIGVSDFWRGNEDKKLMGLES